MATFKNGNMWSAYPESDLFLITTNSTIKTSGALVMGAGIAKQAKLKFPGIEFVLGNEVLKTCGNLGYYYLLISPDWPNKKLGCFQTKDHWAMDSSLDIIEESCYQLTAFIKDRKIKNCNLNFPGIGEGNLDRSKVYPIVKALPDVVTVWEEF